MDINLARETAKLESNYTATDMVVVGYNVSKQSCSVCLPHAGEISCIEVDYKATVQAEFISCREGRATLERVYSDSYCGTDAEDANKTAARLSPIGSTTRIWYNTSNPAVWSRAADYELLSYVSNAAYVGGIITVVLGCLVHRHQPNADGDGEMV
jgi:hypothetical protein